MSVFVLDVPRADPTKPPRNVRVERYVVFGRVEGDTAIVDQVLTCSDTPGASAGTEVWLDDWETVERFALYEEMRKADRNWRSLTEMLGRPDEAPGRVA